MTFQDLEEKERFHQLAIEAGYASSVNTYLLMLLRSATSRAPAAPARVPELEREVARLWAWLEQAREENAELHRHLKALRAQLESREQLLRDLLQGGRPGHGVALPPSPDAPRTTEAAPRTASWSAPRGEEE